MEGNDVCDNCGHFAKDHTITGLDSYTSKPRGYSWCRVMVTDYYYLDDRLDHTDTGTCQCMEFKK